ncbi:hypothetical protein P3X46_027040 [Hevea brasiliensis]|uniref:ABC transporter domain-containing protein n=1 Tax=Hevea brasiliensis TaxID=3981 RepID=A0ABQ9KYJ5_HEVBR|nr:ABC transporter G family member 9-like isoform X2 [Hevea brasiliensis]KAJ9153615.1 hypothetical protein P3X46_027040 [Hevea brasiliensis]
MEQEMADIEAHANNEEHRAKAAAIFKSVNRPVTLKFEDVVYKVALSKAGSCQKGIKLEEKVILKGITGIVLPGEMLAILGPSGSGKTTLLTALGGKLGGHLGGAITYNGKPFSNAMKRNTGFVTQDDVFYPHLTVVETLIFTALLRLSNSLTKENKIKLAEAVINQLGLNRCKNSIIGGPFLRGVSGGERKRVSIGQEMLINPSLLFLDEPTSGLDSTTAQRIVSIVWEQAKVGRTIITTIHQPSSMLFYMFDKVLLLSDGNPLYFGKGSEVMDYFSSVGYTPSVAMNPSDFILDLANGISPCSDSSDNQATVKSLVSAYKSTLSEKLKAEVQEIDNQLQDGVEDKQFEKWATTWWQQFTVLFRRGVKERKHQSFSGLKIGQVLVVALLAGLIWWQSVTSHLHDQIGLLFFYSVFWGFFPLFQAIFTFPQERRMLAKERSSGMYRLSSYFMSRMISDLPMELVLPTIFVTITYWMTGLKRTAQNFLQTLSVLLFNVLAAQGLGLALGAVVMNQKSAAVLGSVIMLSFLLAGGYYVQHVPPFMGWIKYISISQHAFKLLLGSQYNSSDKYPCGNSGDFCLVGDYPLIKIVGLDRQVLSAIALGIMLVGYRVIAYLALMRVGVTRK